MKMTECMGIQIIGIDEDNSLESLEFQITNLNKSISALNALNSALMKMNEKPIDYRDTTFIEIQPDVVAGDSYFFNIMDNWYVTQQVNGLFSKLVKVTNEQTISVINMIK